MEDLYALYLELYAYNQSGNPEQFAEAVSFALSLDSADTVKSIEVYATAAIAVANYDYEDAVGGLLDFYQFQQVWERHRNLFPRVSSGAQ
jgi:hypothetical protein